MSLIMEYGYNGYILTANVNVLEFFLYPANYIMQIEIVTKRRIKNEASFPLSTNSIPRGSVWLFKNELPDPRLI